MTESIGSPLLWTGFTGLILALLALDLGVFHRKAHEVSFREAAIWSVVWIGLALAFNAWIYWAHGPEKGLEFLTGYLIEKALSVDNVFIFLVIFTSFRVPTLHQHRVLFWGVVGALLLRAVFIFVGAAALTAFHWLLYVFGGLLLLTGVRLLVQRHAEEHPERNPLFLAFKSVIPTTGDYHGEKFWVRVKGERLATPLFMVLVLIEITDLIFAVDSIPAIFAITKDPFIVFTSNIFAILGLRALYFCISGFMAKLVYLKTGLAVVLIFVASKMMISEFYKVPIGVSLSVVASILAVSVVASLLRTAPPDSTP